MDRETYLRVVTEKLGQTEHRIEEVLKRLQTDTGTQEDWSFKLQVGTFETMQGLASVAIEQVRTLEQLTKSSLQLENLTKHLKTATGVLVLATLALIVETAVLIAKG